MWHVLWLWVWGVDWNGHAFNSIHLHASQMDKTIFFSDTAYNYNHFQQSKPLILRYQRRVTVISVKKKSTSPLRNQTRIQVKHSISTLFKILKLLWYWNLRTDSSESFSKPFNITRTLWKKTFHQYCTPHLEQNVPMRMIDSLLVSVTSTPHNALVSEHTLFTRQFITDLKRLLELINVF